MFRNSEVTIACVEMDSPVKNAEDIYRKSVGLPEGSAAEKALTLALKRITRIGTKPQQVRAWKRINEIQPSLEHKEALYSSILNNPETKEDEGALARTVLSNLAAERKHVTAE